MFLDRIRKIAGPRRLTPWLLSVGWIKNDVTRINAGVIPGSGKLAQLAIAEGANLTWLLTGCGQPFVVEHFVGDDSAARRITALTSPAGAGRLIRVLGSRGRWHVAVWRAATDTSPELFTTLVGQLGKLCLAAIHDCPNPDILREEHSLPLLPFVAIGEGQIGRAAMLDPTYGLFSPLQGLAAGETLKPFLTARDRLHAAVDEMSEPKAEKWLALLQTQD